jgi:hypothetical protein
MGKHHELGESYANNSMTFSAYQQGMRKTKRKSTFGNQSIGLIKINALLERYFQVSTF